MGEMIRRYCRVPAACYFVAILTDEGKLEYFAGPNQIPNPERIFNAEAFLRSQGRSGSGKDETASGPRCDCVGVDVADP